LPIVPYLPPDHPSTPARYEPLANIEKVTTDHLDWYNNDRTRTLCYLSPAQYQTIHHNADREAA
jgi:Integrase core domain